MKVCAKDLLNARNFAEANQILETIKATPSQRRLTEIAFSNPASRDSLLVDVIREQEGAIDRTDDKTPGEKDIAKRLAYFNIKFERQKTVCKNPETNKHLKADFFLPDYNTYIEYDGEQHFKPVKFGSSIVEAKEAFKQSKKRDRIKNKYCKKHNIGMIRIQYNHKSPIKEIIRNIIS